MCVSVSCQRRAWWFASKSEINRVIAAESRTESGQDSSRDVWQRVCERMIVKFLYTHVNVRPCIIGRARDRNASMKILSVVGQEVEPLKKIAV